MNKSSNTRVVVFIIIILTGAAFFFGSDFFKFSNPKTNLADITFSPKWVNQAQFAGVFVAKDLGYYEDVGIDLKIKEFKTGASVLEDLKSGESQFGLMNANEFLIHRSNGEKIIAVAAFYQISPYMIASLKNNNINTLQDLKGKTLGIKGGSGAEAQSVYDLILASAGIDSNEVNFVVLPLGPSEKDDLMAGRADVVGFYRTRLYQFEKESLSYNAIYPERYGSALYNDVLVVTEDFEESNPDIIRSFIESSVKGWNYAFKNSEEALSIVLNYVTQDVYKDVEFERYILNQKPSLMIPDGNIKNLGKMEISRWQKFYDALNSKGLINAPFDISDSFTTKYLP